MKKLLFAVVSVTVGGGLSTSWAAPPKAGAKAESEKPKVDQGLDIAPVLPAHRRAEPSVRNLPTRPIAHFDWKNMFAEKTKPLAIEGKLVSIEDGTVQVALTFDRSAPRSARKPTQRSLGGIAPVRRYWLLDAHKMGRKLKDKIGQNVRLEMRVSRHGRPYIVGLSPKP